MREHEPPPRCPPPCGKRIYGTEAAALQAVARMRLSGMYRDPYRCVDAAGGWHLRDVKKRLEKIEKFGGAEVDELREKIRRLNLPVPKNEGKPSAKPARVLPLEDALRKLSPSGSKGVGRRGQLQRKRRDNPEDGEARDRGTRGEAVDRYYRRRVERARLREELRREEKE